MDKWDQKTLSSWHLSHGNGITPLLLEEHFLYGCSGRDGIQHVVALCFDMGFPALACRQVIRSHCGVHMVLGLI